MPASPSVPRHICVIRLSALGDIVLAVPAIRALARSWPESRITWLTSPAFLPLLRGLPDNVTLEELDKPGSPADYLELRRRFAARPFDLLLAMQASFRVNLIYPAIRAPVKIGFHGPQARELHGWFVNRHITPGGLHLADGFLAFAAATGVTDLRAEWKLQLDTAAVEWARAATGGQPYLLLNPSSSKADRNWPVARSAQLAREARARHGLPVVLCGGPAAAEREAAAQIEREAPGALNLAGKTSLPQLFALIAGARVLVSPDSGPVHIARAFEVPVVGLYADARSQKTGPYRQMQWTVDRFPEAVRKFLGKEPGEVAWDARIHDPRAMELITVEDVSAKLAAALAAA